MYPEKGVPTVGAAVIELIFKYRPVQGKRPDDTVAKDIVYIDFGKYPKGETP
jgi:hypothetical protein